MYLDGVYRMYIDDPELLSPPVHQYNQRMSPSESPVQTHGSSQRATKYMRYKRRQAILSIGIVVAPGMRPTHEAKHYVAVLDP